jgi:hypothetical protein
MATMTTLMATKAHMRPPMMGWHDAPVTNTCVVTCATLEFFVLKDDSKIILSTSFLSRGMDLHLIWGELVEISDLGFQI